MSVGFDKVDINNSLLLGLPFREGIGIVTKDVAKPQRVLTQHLPGAGTFDWENENTGVPYLEFTPVGGVGVYLTCPAADTADMDFTTEDYSVGGWINWTSGTAQSQIVIGRYGTDLDGWDCYLNSVSSSLSQRHCHASLAPNLSSQCFSAGWIPSTGWHMFGISRRGASLYPLHYRDGVELVMSYEVTGMLDPDPCNREMVMGARAITLAGNWYYGKVWNIRVWGRTLSLEEWKFIYHQEGHWFGRN